MNINSEHRGWSVGSPALAYTVGDGDCMQDKCVGEDVVCC